MSNPAFCQLNGFPVFQATIAFPRVGAWTADVLVADAATFSGPVTLSFDDNQSWSGTVHRGGSPYGTALLRVVGGADGLEAILPAQGYRAATMKIVLNDVCKLCGEKLSAASDGLTLSQQLPQWARIAGNGRQALKQLLDPTVAAWRFNPDGTLWVGPESWPTNDDGRISVTQMPHLNREVFSGPKFSIQPGQVVNGNQVSYARYDFLEDMLQVTVFYEDPAPT